MKIEGNRPTRVSGTSCAGGVKGGASSASISASQMMISMIGIPEAALMPKARVAIMKLMGEIARLRTELNNSRDRIQHLECVADQDSLLPVYNHRAFLRELTRAISMTERYGAPSTLIYFDVNNMKAINDTYGHPAGDAALHHVAYTLRKQVRDSDVVGRLGGDEFGVILYQVDADVAQEKSSNLAQYIAATPVSFNDTELTVQATFGSYTFNGVEDAGQALSEADKAMYKRKNDGRKESATQ